LKSYFWQEVVEVVSSCISAETNKYQECQTLLAHERLTLPSPLPTDNTKAPGNQKFKNAPVRYLSNISSELEKCLRVKRGYAGFPFVSK
jgi:hypothetical protein